MCIYIYVCVCMCVCVFLSAHIVVILLFKGFHTSIS